MGSLKYTKDELCEILIKMQEEIGEDKIINYELLRERKLTSPVQTHFGTIFNMRKELGLNGKKDEIQYTKQDIIDGYSKYYNEHSEFPSINDVYALWKENNIAPVHVVKEFFTSWDDLKYNCGVPMPYVIRDQEGNIKKEYDDPVFLKQLLKEICGVFGHSPTQKQVDKYYGVQLGKYYRKHYGSYNNCLKELGYNVKVREYSDEELRKAFMNFVEKYHRTPSYNEFTSKKGYPSAGSYVAKFGSWVNTCIHFGVKPNCRKPEYYLENGERCDSRFEVDVSRWLTSHNIYYERNIPYKCIDKKYTGNMNCDYCIKNNDSNTYLEIAGFVKSLDEAKYSDEELKYIQKLKYKVKLLERSCVDYKIIFRNDLENNKLDNLLSFLL